MTIQPNRRRLELVTFAVASALFFLSGGTGLAYQVIWSKRFSHVWGSSTLAMAAVVASFLFGLGLGAHLFGRYADRARSCLFGYGVAEVLIGILALLIPYELRLLSWISSGLYPLLWNHHLTHSLARFGLTFLVIGPPCILMGGTLPLLIKHFTPQDSTPKVSAGWLYAINTLGAAAGAYAAGFHLLPSFGLQATNVAVAALNLVLGGIAILLARGTQAEATDGYDRKGDAAAAMAEKGKPPRAMVDHGVSLAPLYLTVALTGCASLLLELIWTRQLALMLGSSTYAFSAMLALLLLGIGLGSLLYHLFLRKSDRIAFVPAIVITGICVTACAGKLLIPQASIAVGSLRDLRASQAWNAAIAISASALIELLPAIGMGLLFPIFIDMTRKRAADAGKAIGAIYAWNTVGSIAGATAAYLLLVPRIGTAKTEALAVALYGAAMLVTFPRSPGAFRGGLLATLCVILSLSGYAMSRQLDPLSTDIGIYMYGYTGNERSKYIVKYFKEGGSSNVLVTQQGKDFALRVNGKVDASSADDMNMQLGLAYMPLLLSPAAREICVIGFGSGSTSGAALLFPDTRVTCCEIEPAVFEASIHFTQYNHAPEQSKRFSIIYDDGRSHLQGTATQYDLILSEPSNPWIAGVSNLFTREFYTAAKKRLSPGGILAQWIQVYSSSAESYAMIARTLLDVFPECALIRISVGDTILLASDAPFGGGKESMDRAQALVESNPAVQANLQRFYGTKDVRSLLLRHVVLDTAGVRKFVDTTGPMDLNTDLNMKLEFEAPRRLFDRSDVTAEIQKKLLASADGQWFRAVTARWGCGKEQAAAFHEISRRYDRSTQAALIGLLVETGLQLDPERPELLVDTLAQAQPRDPAEFTRAAARVLALSKKEANRLGVLLFKGGSFARSIEVFQQVLAAHPESATAWNNLAIAYEAWGKLDEAEKTFQKSLALDPMNEQTRKSYDAFRSKHPGKTRAAPAAAETRPAEEDEPREDAP